MRVLVGAAVFLVMLGGIVAGVLTQPLDISGNVALPRPIERIKERDGVAYRGHRYLGTALARLEYPPDAVALQWLKAAAHARSDREVDRAARYLEQARERAGSADQFDASLCRWIVGRYLTQAQRNVVQKTDVRCAA